MNPLDTLQSRGPVGQSLFAGNDGMNEDQRIEAFGRLVGAAPAEAAPEEEQPAPEAVTEEQPKVEEEPVVDRSRPVGMALPTVDLDAAEAELADSIGKEAAKAFMNSVARPLTAQVNGVAQASAQARVERLVSKFGNVYPELKRQGALEAVVRVSVADMKPGESDEVAFKRGLVTIYGDRKAEMRSQVMGQMSAPSRRAEAPKAMTADEVNIAALHEYQKTGSVQAALALKQKLTSGR